MRRERGRNLARGTFERSCPHVRIGAAQARDLGSGAQDEGPFVFQGATGVSGHTKTVLGMPALGQGGTFQPPTVPSPKAFYFSNLRSTSLILTAQAGSRSVQILNFESGSVTSILFNAFNLTKVTRFVAGDQFF